MSRLSIDDLKALQHARGLTDVHLVSLDDYGFTIAHTDAERTSGMNLEECGLHDWLLDNGPLDCGDGEFIATAPEHDPVSVSFRSGPWHFERMPS